MICFLSLATAGYGTALGVIRALHSQGVLTRAYCTETRPFNQVSNYCTVDFCLVTMAFIISLLLAFLFLFFGLVFGMS